MIQTCFVYITLTLVMLLLSHLAVRRKKFWPILVALICYAVIFGMRWGVGADYFGYNRAYNYVRIFHSLPSITKEHWEGGFKWYVMTVAGLGAHFSIFFGIIAFIQLFLYYFRLRNEQYIFTFLTFTFMMSGQWLSFSNGLRQILAVSIFFYALPFLRDRKLLQYCALVFAASLFHKSAELLFLLFPVYYFRKTYFNNVKTEFIILGCSLIIMQFGVMSGYFEKLNGLISFMEYDHYEHSEVAEQGDLSPGLGFYITFGIYCICIYYSQRVKRFLPNTIYPLLYDLFFIGVNVKYMFFGIQLVQRVNYYFQTFSFVIGAYTLYYLYRKHCSYKIRGYEDIFIPPLWLLAGFYVLTFIAVLYRMDENTALYQFWWQAS